MPRVPTARVTSGQISYTPTGSVAAVAFESLAELTGQAADIGMKLEEEKEDIRRKTAVSSNLLNLTMGLSDLAISEENNPDHAGSNARFALGSEALNKELLGSALTAEEQSDYASRANSILATHSALVKRVANRKFVVAERVKLVEFGERTAIELDRLSSSLAAGADPVATQLLIDHTRDTFFQASELSSIVGPDFQKTIRDDLESDQSTARALRLLSKDPEALLEVIDQGGLPNMDPVEQARFLARALSAADTNDRAADRKAAATVKETRENNRRKFAARLLPGHPEAFLKEAIDESGNVVTDENGDVVKTNEFDSQDARDELVRIAPTLSAAGVEALTTQIKGRGALVDDPTIVVDLKTARRAGVLTQDMIDRAYSSRNITLPTANAFETELTAEKDEAMDEAEQLISDALGATQFDEIAERGRAALEERRAIDEFRLRVEAQEKPVSSRHLNDLAVEIISARAETITHEARDRLLIPYSIRNRPRISDVTIEDLEKSDLAIAKALDEKRLSKERSVALLANNEKVRKILRAKK